MVDKLTFITEDKISTSIILFSDAIFSPILFFGGVEALFIVSLFTEAYYY